MTRSALVLSWMVVSAACSGATAVRSGAPPLRPLAYGPEAFEVAARTERLVFLDVGIEGCTWCQRFHERTLADEAVRRELAEHFVLVSVDADVLPDLGGRYEPMGWPALVFLAADGTELGVVQGFRGPGPFLELLAAARRGDLHAPPPARPSSADALEDLYCAANRRLAALVDERGIGAAPRVVLYEPVRWLYTRGEPRARDAARAMTDGYRRLLDPVWGGVYVAARGPDFSGAIVEKRTVNEAWAIGAFALALRRTGDPDFERAAREVLRYMNGPMRAPDGLFHATQRDAPSELPDGLSPERYHELDDAGRRAIGVPDIDLATYTDQNAVMIEALIALHEATGDPALIAEARAVEHALARRIRDAGWIAQVDTVPPAAMRLRSSAPSDRPYVRAEGAMGRAWLALHRVSGDGVYLDRAHAAAGVLLETLEDHELGGFSSPPRMGSPAAPPYWDNLIAAAFLGELAGRTHGDAVLAERYGLAAERAIRRVSGGPDAIARDGLRLALLVEALEQLLGGPIQVSVVATPSQTPDALLAAGREYDDPRVRVLRELPGHYPADVAAVAYVCTGRSCSSPVREPGALARVIAGAIESTFPSCAAP